MATERDPQEMFTEQMQEAVAAIQKVVSMNMEAVSLSGKPGNDGALEFGCFGSFGSFGSVTGCAGTAGTFGCAGVTEERATQAE